jgi:tRNA (guanine10-N2)-dimethyltransferase
MTFFLYLSGENPPLAGSELRAALKALGADDGHLEVFDRVAILDQEPPVGIVGRLGMCHFAGPLEGVHDNEREDILAGVSKVIEGLDPDKSLAPLIRMHRGTLPFTADRLFHDIEEAIRAAGRKLHLRSPDSKVFVVVAGKAFVGHTTQTSSRSELLSRRGSKLAFSRPVMMDPRVSRAMVNLMGLEPGKKVLDPFMGPGGLIMEAARSGYHCIGIEIDPRVLAGALKNFDSEGLSGQVIAFQGDSRELHGMDDLLGQAPFDGLLTDPPFGRSASSGGNAPGDLIRTVLERARGLLIDGAPVVLDVPEGNMLEGIVGYELSAVFKLRVHRSLTRHIGVLRAV